MGEYGNSGSTPTLFETGRHGWDFKRAELRGGVSLRALHCFPYQQAEEQLRPASRLFAFLAPLCGIYGRYIRLRGLHTSLFVKLRDNNNIPIRTAETNTAR